MHPSFPDDCYVPMVSFCDIPLSQIENHVNEYGDPIESYEIRKGYGLGLSIDWALKKSISPVTYVPVRTTDPNTDQMSFSLYLLQKQIYSFLTFAIGIPNKELTQAESLMHRFYLQLLHLMAYLKPYIGIQNNKKRKFYDEKEWRYIPSVDALPNNNQMFIRIPDYGPELTGMKMLFSGTHESHYGMNLDDAIKLGREHMFKHYLEFDPEDIKYIIVHSNEEILEIVDKLKTLPHKYSESQRQIITSKILTYEQLREDF